MEESKQKTSKRTSRKRSATTKKVTAKQAATMMKIESSLYEWLDKMYPHGTEKTTKDWAELFVSGKILDEVPSIFKK